MTSTASPASTKSLGLVDKARIGLAGYRYNWWLDMRFVPGKQRRSLARELRSNLREAAAVRGTTAAIDGLGSLRVMAAEASTPRSTRSRWYMGVISGLGALALLVFGFMLLSAYYTEGVMDAGATEPVSSWLFPYFGSSVTVEAGTHESVSMSFQTGPLPFVAGLAAFTLVAKPWRSLRR